MVVPKKYKAGGRGRPDIDNGYFWKENQHSNGAFKNISSFRRPDGIDFVTKQVDSTNKWILLGGISKYTICVHIIPSKLLVFVWLAIRLLV